MKTFINVRDNGLGGYDAEYEHSEHGLIPYTLERHECMAVDMGFHEVPRSQTAQEIAELRSAEAYISIIGIESTLTPRREREALRTGDYSFIDAAEAELELLREIIREPIPN